VLFFFLLAAVIFTRASFQAVWLLVVLVILLVTRRETRGTILKAAAIPVLLVALLYAKQFAQFGVPSTTSWFGMNLARITVGIAPRSQLQTLVADGKLSKIVLVQPFSPLSEYSGMGIPPARQTGVPALDDATKANGAVNLNNLAYIDLSRRYLRQSLLYIRYEPFGYLHGVGKALGKLSVPATDYSYVFPERSKVRVWDRVFNAVVYWRTPWAHGIGFALPLMYVAEAIWGLTLLVRSVRARVGHPPATTVLFIWATTVYLLLLAALTDFGENQRVHLPIDPLVLILAALVCRDLAHWVQARRVRADQASRSSAPS
jgi:hypothetical protein